MAPDFPYTFYSCPCSDISSSGDAFAPLKEEDEQDDEQTFNPYSARANFALYPIENLLFCNECHEIRCPRCYYEEAVYYYCPNCLMEATSQSVKSDSNRCQRSCFDCPVCFANLQLKSYESPDADPNDNSDENNWHGPYILSCSYCAWSTLDIGISVEKHVNVNAQLSRIQNGGQPFEGLPPRPEDRTKATMIPNQFSNLAMFYKNQIAETSPQGPMSMNSAYGLDSPGHLSRLLTTYGAAGIKKQRGKVPVMREAAIEAEGSVADGSCIDGDEEVINKMRELGWDGVLSSEQRARQTTVYPARFFSDVRPAQTQLRSKRAKRCRTCRHNLLRPDDRRMSTRFKIRLLAINYIPRVSVRPLNDDQVDCAHIRPFVPTQFLVTFRNPLFEEMKITLATPPNTSGQIPARVTILCPQFEIGATKDVWDEALDSGNKDRRRTRDLSNPAESQQPEAGKTWERGRNWTTIVLEVIPIKSADEAGPNFGLKEALEVAILVRMEYEAEDTGADPYAISGSSTKNASKEKKVKKDFAYWVVLGLGRVAAITSTNNPG